MLTPGSTWPSQVDKSGIRRSTFSPARYQPSKLLTANAMSEIMRSGSGPSAASVQTDLADQLREGAVVLLTSHSSASAGDEERRR